MAEPDELRKQETGPVDQAVFSVRSGEAEAFVINTCSVTHVADQKSRKLIRSARRLSPDAPLAVTGCFPRSAGDAAATELGANIVVGTSAGDHLRIVEFLADSRTPELGDRGRGNPSHSNRLRTRAFIKAQEGCSDGCAFCIVPRTRGAERSRSLDSVVSDVDGALSQGALEVVITGTQLGAWGRDSAPKEPLAKLMAGLLERTETPRLRLSSLQPQDITPELVGLWEDPRLMPHFHLSLQSGSDSILTAMRRRYDTSTFGDAVLRLRAAVPSVAITTDVIAGFPGETNSDFNATIDFSREMEFSRIHVFPYSVRSRTLAAKMSGQVPAVLKRERVAELNALGSTLSGSFQNKFTGTVRPVLWEESAKPPFEDQCHGYTDNYIRVRAPGSDLLNRITPAKLQADGDGEVKGEVMTP